MIVDADSVDLFDVDADIDEYKESEDHKKAREELEHRPPPALPCDKEAVAEDGERLCSIYEVRVEKATAWKEEANRIFKTGEYNRALSKYSGCLIFLRGVDEFLDEEQVTPDIRAKIEKGNYPTPGEKEAMRAVKVAVYNNMAVCLYLSKFDWRNGAPQYDKIIKYCDEVLKLDPDNVKALFKKGKALFYKEEFEDAIRCLEKAQNNASSGTVDPEIIRYKKEAKKSQAAHDKEMGKLFKGVFDKMGAQCVDDDEKDVQQGKVRKSPKWVVA